MVDNSSPLKKHLIDDKLIHSARRDAYQFRVSTKDAEAAKAKAESELFEAKKTVKDLASRIEESNSRVKKIEELEKQKKSKMQEEDQYEEVIKELEYVKEEVLKLKVDMAFVLKDKRRANKEIDASSSKFHSYSNSVEMLRRQIDELNEEHVIVELARIEALSECAAIEDQRKDEAKQYSVKLEGTRNKMNHLIDEINSTKELEADLAGTTSDVNLLTSELAVIKSETQKHENSKYSDETSTAQGEEVVSQSFLNAVLEELESAKKELASINEEGFQFTASMEVVREEIKHLREEIVRLRKTEEKADLTIQSLNSKLLRAKTKLDTISAAERKATSVSSSLAVSLEQLKTEVEAARREGELILEETAKIKAEIPKTEAEIELAEAKLEATMQDLTAVKSSEAVALENLKAVVENTMRTRVLSSEHSSTITISAFEYEYLKGRAAGAEELADKKVAAAQAWIEALKASEKEILMKMEMNQREIRELRVEEDNKIQRSEPKKNVVEGDVWDWEQKQVSISKLYKNSSISKQPKFRKSGSLAARQVSKSSSVIVERRRKGMPNLTNLLSNPSIEKNWQNVDHKRDYYVRNNEQLA